MKKGDELHIHVKIREGCENSFTAYFEKEVPDKDWILVTKFDADHKIVYDVVNKDWIKQVIPRL